MRFFQVLALCLLVLISSNLIFAKKKKSKIKIPEMRGWKYEDQVLDDEFINNIDIVKLDNGDLRAYYMGSGNISSLISTDDGLSFGSEAGIRLVGASHHALIKLDNGDLRMYFSKINDGNLRSAISSDGLSFTEEDGIRLALGSQGEPDSAGIIHPSIVRDAQSKFRLYYDAISGTGRFPEDAQGIMSASSDDGLVFVKDQGFRVEAGEGALRFASLVWSPFLEFENNLFKLYFSLEAGKAAKQGAYLASSSDGVNFNIHKKPILKRDKRLGPNEPGVGGLPGLPQDLVIVPVEGGKRMFYWSAGGHGTYSAFLKLKTPVSKPSEGNKEAEGEEEEEVAQLSLTSSSFANNGLIPSKHTCDGGDISPPLSISGVPAGTESLAVIMDDPDAVAVAQQVWDHWIVFNIPPETRVINEGESIGTVGRSTAGILGYEGSCPPAGRTHSYSFRLYALDTTLDLAEGSRKSEVLNAMAGSILSETELIGRYGR